MQNKRISEVSAQAYSLALLSRSATATL